MFQILTFNKNNEPCDINFVNLKEEVFFSYDSSTSSTSGPILNDTEKWVWNFDEGYTNGTAGLSDQKIFESIGFIQPSTIFYRAGNRNVSVNVYDESGTNWSLKYNDVINFNVFEFPTTIIGPDFASYNTDIFFNLNGLYSAQNYVWKINGQIGGTNGATLPINDFKIKSLIECTITNGISSITLNKICIVSIPNSVYGKIYESDVTPKLQFFNKEGDNLNFDLTTDNGVTRWEGDMIFNSNSSDTFKTIGLYILENVDPIKVESKDLVLEKMQIFNEFGIDFQAKQSDDILITNVYINTIN